MTAPPPPGDGSDQGIGARKGARMPEQRHVYRVGNSMVVALPARVREHLGLKAGESVYWHLVRHKEAVLTRKERRAGGHPEGLALQRELEAARRETERLRRKLGGRSLRVLGEGISQGWGMAASEGLSVGRRLDEVLDLLRDLSARIPFRARRRVRAAGAPAGPGAERVVEDAGSVDGVEAAVDTVAGDGVPPVPSDT